MTATASPKRLTLAQDDDEARLASAAEAGLASLPYDFDEATGINVDRRPDEVAERFGAESLQGRTSATPRFRLYDDLELGDFPDPAWLITDLIPDGGFASLYAPAGTGKSFLALDWAFSIAALRAWRGRPVTSGPVVYVAAEGKAGMKSRVQAWKYVHDIEGRAGAGVYFLPEALPVPDLTAVLAFCRDVAAKVGRPVRLIILDTLARMFHGLNESATEDMGRFIAGVDLMRRETSAAVLVIHHTGWNDTRERGNSSLRGAVDAALSLSKSEEVLILEVVKQKDAPTAEKIRLVLQPVHDSCVLASADGIAMPSPKKLTPGRRKLLEAIRDTDAGDGVSHSSLEKSARVPEGSFDRVLKDCRAAGWVAATKAKRYSLTTEGSAAIGIGIEQASERYR